MGKEAYIQPEPGVKEASSIPTDMLRSVQNDISRGGDPEELAEIGYHVPGVTELRFDDAARVMAVGRSARALPEEHLEDPEFDADWQEQRELPVESIGTVATGSLTSRQKNAAERSFRAAHYRRAHGPSGWRQLHRR